jgi:5-methylcytosine-specific restriction endonuclease McrA
MCGSKKSLQVHHILEYSKYPSLRTEVSNLITLCYSDHKSIKGKENNYVEFFTDKVRKNESK